MYVLDEEHFREIPGGEKTFIAFMDLKGLSYSWLKCHEEGALHLCSRATVIENS